mgnify:CR=1 FL=1
MSDAAMIVAGAIACLGLAGAGSALGTGFAATAAVGAWKKCYAAGKPAPFLLLSFVGAPITQTLYGMILMFIMLGKVEFVTDPEGAITGVKALVCTGAGLPCLVAGIFAGLAIGLALVLIHLVCINLTGTSVNPARSIGPALFAGGQALADLWVFIVAPLVGGALAALVWKCFSCNKCCNKAE